MIGQLKSPRPGFEAVTRAHFRLLRWRIMRQCAKWMEQATALDPLFQASLGPGLQRLSRREAFWDCFKAQAGRPDV